MNEEFFYNGEDVMEAFNHWLSEIEPSDWEPRDDEEYKMVRKAFTDGLNTASELGDPLE